MAQRRRFSAEYKREAVAMLESPGVGGRAGTNGLRPCVIAKPAPQTFLQAEIIQDTIY